MTISEEKRAKILKDLHSQAQAVDLVKKIAGKLGFTIGRDSIKKDGITLKLTVKNATLKLSHKRFSKVIHATTKEGDIYQTLGYLMARAEG